MANVCVAHLVRAINGIEPFKKFIESYKSNQSGLEHELLIIYKGFNKNDDLFQYEQILADIPNKTFFVQDIGLDISTYLKVLKSFGHEYFCFLNSFSIILDKEWLAKMYSHASRIGVGLVGATGSYESIFTDLKEQYKIIKSKNGYNKKLRWQVYCRLIRYRFFFLPFPNYHIRSNSFMISASVARKLQFKKVMTKLDAWKFESGKKSLTQQVLGINLLPLVIGRDGSAYEKEEWFKSNTFWHGGQSNLLISDNQTRFYMDGDKEAKMRQKQLAWGQ